MKKNLKIVTGILLGFLFISYQVSGQTSQTAGGDWHTGSTWIGGNVPATNNTTILVDGPVVSNLDLSFDNNVILTVNNNDTLIINGNLTFNNGAELYINSGAVLIVRGNLTSQNNLQLSADAYLVVTGNLDIKNNGDITSSTEPSKIFIGGTITDGNGTTGNVLDCSGTTDYNSGCNYGNLVDLIDDPIFEIINDACTPAVSYYNGGEPSSNSPVAVGGTINLSANPNPGSGASIIAYAWSGPNGFQYNSTTDANTTISNADASMSGYYTFVAFNSEGCYVKDSTYVLVNDCCSGASYYSLDNHQGDWSDVSTWGNPNDSWRPLPPPTDGSSAGYNQSLCISGYVTLNGDLTLNNNSWTICDTLVITGNLNTGSFSLDVVTGGILIVLGDYTGTNGTFDNSGDVVVAGEVNDNYTLEGSGNTYLFDTSPSGNFNGGFSSAGDETTLQTNDPDLYSFFQSALCGAGISGGTIGSNETICSGTQASEISNILEGTPAGSITYSWYSSTNSTDPATGTWTVVTDSTRISLSPGTLTQTTSYYRLSTLGAGCTAMSNVVTITVSSVPTPSITSGSTTVCEFEFTNYLTDATGTINWSVTGGTITSGQGTNTIEVQWAELVSPATSAAGSVTIEENTAGCTGTDVLNTTVHLLPNTGPTYRKPNN